MKRYNVIFMASVLLITSLWTVFYIVTTFKSQAEYIIDAEFNADRDVLYKIDEKFYETQSNFSRTSKADLIEEVLLCLAESLTSNKTNSKKGAVVEFMRRSEDAKEELTKMELAYKGLLQELQQKDDVIEFMSQPIINFHEFEYIHNPKNVCSHSEAVRYLFVVPSATENFDRRSKFRNSTLYNYISKTSNHIKLLFFIGKPPKGRKEKEIQDKITKELSDFKDIVQEDYDDNYPNMRLKAVSMLRWAITFCKKAKFVIRTDDDVRISYEKLFPLVEKTSKRFKNFILGDRKEGWKPVRLRRNKYYLSKEDFPTDTYPPFAVGGLLAYPISTVSLLYQAALRIKPIWLDDVFITGVCATKVGVPLLTDPVVKFEHELEKPPEYHFQFVK